MVYPYGSHRSGVLLYENLLPNQICYWSWFPAAICGSHWWSFQIPRNNWLSYTRQLPNQVSGTIPFLLSSHCRQVPAILHQTRAYRFFRNSSSVRSADHGIVFLMPVHFPSINPGKSIRGISSPEENNKNRLSILLLCRLLHILLQNLFLPHCLLPWNHLLYCQINRNRHDGVSWEPYTSCLHLWLLLPMHAHQIFPLWNLRLIFHTLSHPAVH